MTRLKPVPVNDVEVTLGGDMKKLLPSIVDIPKEFFDGNKWVDFVNDWFFNGITKDVNSVIAPGVDEKEAIRHVKAILVSFDPNHEHKIAGVAYLLSNFFVKLEVVES